MNIRKMDVSDIDSVLKLYIDYYNEEEDSCWTQKSAYKRIHQVLAIEDSFSLIMFGENQNAIGFVMGYLKQYDDIVGYALEEIIVDGKEQNKGYGTQLLFELENRIKEMGVSCIELEAVNDGMHEYFYGKLGYLNSDTLVNKVKWFE